MEVCVVPTGFIVSEEKKSIIDDGIHLNDEEFNLSSSDSIQSDDRQSSLENDFSDEIENEEHFRQFDWPENTDEEFDHDDNEKFVIDHFLTTKQLKIALELEEKPYRRVKRSNKKLNIKSQCREKQMKSVRFFPRTGTIYIHHRLYKRIQLDPPSYNYLPSDRYVPIYSPEGLRTPIRSKVEKPTRTTTTTTSSHVYPPAPVIPTEIRAFTLTEQTRTHQSDFDDAMIALLMDLQNRDLSPEDYEILLRLDERVQRKTVNTSVLNSLPNIVVDEKYLDEICSICIETYLRGQTLKILPCSHVFHSECIEKYLQEFSVQCPLDNLPLM